MASSPRSPLMIAAVVLLAYCALMITFVHVRPTAPHVGGVTADAQTQLANALVARSLYKEAAAEFDALLATQRLSDKERAALLLTVAKLHMEHTGDYRAASVALVTIRELYPKSPSAEEAGKLMVEAFERAGMPLEAQNVLNAATNVGSASATSGLAGTGEVVARIGKRAITMSELDQYVRDLPPQMQMQMSDARGRFNALRQYVGTELLMEAAQRKGLDNDPDIQRRAYGLKKNLLMQRVLNDDIGSKIAVTPQDVELYYRANIGRYSAPGKDGKPIARPLEEVRQQVESDYRSEKMQAAQGEYFQKLTSSQDVQLYFDKFGLSQAEAFAPPSEAAPNNAPPPSTASARRSAGAYVPTHRMPAKSAAPSSAPTPSPSAPSGK